MKPAGKAHSKTSMRKQLAARYQVALRKHLVAKSAETALAAQRLGRMSVIVGMEVLDVVIMHQQAVLSLVATNEFSTPTNEMLKRAGIFFTQIIPRSIVSSLGVSPTSFL